MTIPNEHRMIGQISECKIGGKNARVQVYRVYDRIKEGASAPIRFDWEIYIDGEGTVAKGSSERDDQWRHRQEVIKQLRKERRKKA